MQTAAVANRLEGALDDGVALLALTIDERAMILASLEDPTGLPNAPLGGQVQTSATGS